MKEFNKNRLIVDSAQLSNALFGYEHVFKIHKFHALYTNYIDAYAIMG